MRPNPGRLQLDPVQRLAFGHPHGAAVRVDPGSTPQLLPMSGIAIRRRITLIIGSTCVNESPACTQRHPSPAPIPSIPVGSPSADLDIDAPPVSDLDYSCAGLAYFGFIRSFRA